MQKITQDIFLIFLGGCLALLFLKCCTMPTPLPKGSHTETHDTIFRKGDSVKVSQVIRQPYPVYSVVTDTVYRTMNLCDSTRFYSDIFEIDSTSHFIIEDSVIGKKLWSSRKYLGQPYYKQIITTITDSIPYGVVSYKGGWYLSGGLGIGLKNCLYVGGDFVSAKQWSAGYAYDLLNKTHNGFFRWKIY